jgi:hypothetical protein
LLLVGVVARRPDGAATKLALPGPTASARVAYLTKTTDGSWITSGHVDRDGRVLGDAGMGQPDPQPGARLEAVMSPRGRVLCVQERRTS